ncbi:MAG: PAS domain-containing protein [Desulfobacteraceae bacterium]|jgi:PAS domain S-box-containing protein
MSIVFWILLLICIASGAWGFHRYQVQARSLDRLRDSLTKATRKVNDNEKAHKEKEAQWETDKSKLRSYLQLLDTLINTIPNPIYFKDENGVFQGCNRVFSKEILGLTRDRIIGRRPQDLPDRIPPDLASAYQREEARVIEKGGPHTFEAQVQRADGQRRDFLFSLAPVTDETGKPGGSVAVLSDLTDKNRAARDRMEKEKLEGVLETAGAVCHELNQPLQAVSGYTELIAAALNDHPAAKYIEKLIDQIERMRDITDKLQGITRVEVTDYAGNTKIIDLHKSSAKE